MSYTTDLINQRRGQKITGSQIDGSQVDRKPSEKLTFTQQVIQQRRQNFDSFDSSRKSLSAEPVEIVKPERKGIVEKTKGFLQDFGEQQQQGTDIFSKGKNLVQRASDWVFGSDRDIIEAQKVDLVSKISTKKQEGKNTKEEESQLSMIAKIEDPNVDKATKQQFKQYIRLSRYGQQLQASTAQLFASLLGVSRQQEEAEAERQADFYSDLLKKSESRGKGNLTEYYKKEKEYWEAVRDGTGKTRSEEGIDKLNKWADEVDVAYPTNSEKVVHAGGSMAVFAVASVLSRGSTAVPVVMEGLSEAGSVYSELRDQGKSIEESSNRANVTFVANLIVSKFLNVFEEVGKAKGVKQIVKGIGTEGGQEGTQQVISNLATERPVEEGVIESVIIGGILGGTTVLAFPSTQTTGIPADPDTFINELIASDFAKTKDGQKLMKTALDAKKQGKSLLVNIDDGKTSVSIGEQAYNPAETTGEQGITDQTQEEKSEEGTKEVESTKVTQTPSPTDGGEVTPGETTKKETEVVSGGEETFDFSSTQLNLPEQTAKQVTEYGKTKIAPEDLFKDPEANYEAQKTGLENEPHVTVLYGLDTKEAEDVRKIVEGVDPIELEIGEVSIFEGENNDVVKADVTGDALRALNKKLDEAIDTPGNEFKDYKPHVTIAYVQKGAGQKYVGDKSLAGQKITLNELTFSSKDGTQTTIPLLGKKSAPKTEKTPEKKASKPTKTVSKKEVVEKPTTKKPTEKKTVKKEVEKKEPEVKQEEKPKKKYEAQEGGQTKASKVAVSIEQKLGEKLENVAGFESINIKDQIKRAEDLLNKNLIRARGMISGKIPLPDGLRAGAFIKGVEIYAEKTGDMSLLRSLAVSPLVSETSIHAQELRLLAERDENSVLTKIQSIANERAKIAEKKYGQKVDKLLKDETKKIKDSIKKVDKHNWSDFLKSIEC